MKTLTKLALVLIPTITLSMTATAHDPKLHAKKAEKADCSKMDHSKIDMKDPVAIAMMKKCMKQAEKSKGKLKDKEIKMEKKEIKMKDKEMKMKMKMKDKEMKIKEKEMKMKEKDDDNEHNH